MAEQDETDERFRELILDQFGQEVASRAPTENRRPDDFVDFFDLDDAIANAEPVYDERWIAPVPDEIPRPSSPRTLAGLVVAVISAVFATLALVGVSLPGWVGTLAFAGFGVGLALLLAGIPKRRETYDDFDDGARL